ncbi:hypothetical protein LINPERHAP1_LOCUS8552 [Linum perenne]
MLERISSGFGRRRGWQISSAVEVVCLEESPPAMTTGSRDSEVLRGIGETNQSTVKTWRSSSNRVVKQAFQFRQQAVEQPVSGEACSVESFDRVLQILVRLRMWRSLRNLWNLQSFLQLVKMLILSRNVVNRFVKMLFLKLLRKSQENLLKFPLSMLLVPYLGIQPKLVIAKVSFYDGLQAFTT